MGATWRAYMHLGRVHQPIGYVLLLWPTLWGLWAGFAGMPPWWILLIFVLGVLVTRSAGCMINDMADRDLDGHVARTAARPLACGAMTFRQALWAAGGMVVLAGLLALLLGAAFVAWSLPALGLMVLYPFAKRWCACPQLFLSLAFSWSVVLGWLVSGQSMAAPLLWWLFAANVFWTIAYDTMYAMADKPEDLKLAMHSLAITLGRFDWHGVGVCAWLAMLCWAKVLWLLHAPFLSWLMLGVAWWLLLRLWWRGRCPQACFAGFLGNAYVGGWLWLSLCWHFQGGVLMQAVDKYVCKFFC